MYCCNVEQLVGINSALRRKLKRAENNTPYVPESEHDILLRAASIVACLTGLGPSSSISAAFDGWPNVTHLQR
jgi:hypothetical protein